MGAVETRNRVAATLVFSKATMNRKVPIASVTAKSKPAGPSLIQRPMSVQ